MKETRKVKRLKDLPAETPICGLKVRISDYEQANLPKEEMYIKSIWFHGLWLVEDAEAERTYPYNCDRETLLNLEVIEE